MQNEVNEIEKMKKDNLQYYHRHTKNQNMDNNLWQKVKIKKTILK